MGSRHDALSKKDYEALAAFRYALRKFLGFSEAAARQYGLTPQQYQGLLAIEGFPGRNWVSVGELAEQLRIAHHSAVGLIDRMESMRLVRRSPSQEDRRRVQVSLTSKGLKLLEKMYRIHRDELRSTGPRLATLLHQAAAQIPTRGANRTTKKPSAWDD